MSCQTGNLEVTGKQITNFEISSELRFILLLTLRRQKHGIRRERQSMD